MLDPLVVANNGSVQLNSLKRYTLSAVVVPRQDLAVVNVPAAPSATQPGMSTPIPLQGPSDGRTELYSFTAQQSVKNAGIGTITTILGNATVNGVGTKFLTQLSNWNAGSGTGLTFTYLADDNTVNSGTIQTIVSDTQLILAVVAAKTATAKPFVYTNANNGILSNAKLYVSIKDQAWRRYLMNRDVPAQHVFGDNLKPLFIKESILLENDQGLLLNFYNYDTGSINSIAPMTEGRKWQFEAMKYPKVEKFIEDLRQRKKWVQPYWLTLDDGFYNIAAGASQGGFLTVTGDITFVAFNACAFAINVNDGDQSDLVTVELSDAKTHRALTVQPVPLTCAAGTAQDPYRLPTPWIIEPQTQIKANFVNGYSDTVRVAFTLHGVAVYTGSNFNGSTLTNQHLIEEAGKMYNAMSIPQVRAAGPQI